MVDATSATTTSSDRRTGSPQATLVIGILVVSAFVMILNETILSVALRDLTVDLDVQTTTAQWLTSGFLLTMAVVIPTTGFLLERFTPRQVFVASLTSFCLGTLLNGLAPGFGLLLVGRVVQACGTAVMLPLLMTSVMRLVPRRAARRHHGHDHDRHRRRPRPRTDDRRGRAVLVELALDVLDSATAGRRRTGRRSDLAAGRQPDQTGATGPALGGALRGWLRWCPLRVVHARRGRATRSGRFPRGCRSPSGWQHWWSSLCARSVSSGKIVLCSTYARSLIVTSSSR